MDHHQRLMSDPLLGLLRAARCEHYLERFRRYLLVGEVFAAIDRGDFVRMGITQAEQQRILDALNQNGGEEPAGPEEDVEGLDPNDDDTCKICMEEYVDIRFLPCGHQWTCSRCGADLSRCILCLARVDSVQHLDVARRQRDVPQ